MRHGPNLKTAAGAILLATQATLTAAADGDILNTEACAKWRAVPYEDYVRNQIVFARQSNEQAVRAGIPPASLLSEAEIPASLPGKEEFERSLAYDGFECRSLTYASDGLAIKGYIWRPQGVSNRKLPAIIFNRGGNHEDGYLYPSQHRGFHKFLVSGFVVLASQYRQAAGSQGRDEYGGADVNDVLNLLKLARALPYVDSENIFMMGESRGAMMTALALKKGAVVNAAALLSPVLDLVEMSVQRPIMNSLFEELIPDFPIRREASLQERSALAWPELIRKPLLLLHGTGDWRVGASQSIALAAKLRALGKLFELHVYEGDNHGLMWNSADRDEKTIRFFRSYMTADRKL